MFDLTTLTAEAFGQEISAAYHNTFGGREPQRADFLAASARLAVERIANSDALYHDVHHTIMVTSGRSGHPARPDHHPAGDARRTGNTSCWRC